MVTDPAEASGPFPFLGTNPIEIEPLELAVSVCEGVWKCLQIFDVFGLELLPSHDEVVRASAHAGICGHSEGLLDLVFEVGVGHEEV